MRCNLCDLSLFGIVWFSVPKYSRAIENDLDLELPHRGCYLPDWSDTRPGSGRFDISMIDPSLCTYMCYAFAGIVNNILTVDPSDELKFRQLNTFKIAYPKLKILLSVGGWNLSHQFLPMASSPENRTMFIDSVLVGLRTWGLDGLDLDWEYPPQSSADYFTALLKELRLAFEAESRLLERPRLILAAAVGSTSRGGYSPLVMARTLDILNLMAYDFHGPTWEPNRTSHNAPLIKSPTDPNPSLNVEGLVKEWEFVGIPKSIITVGLALYGRSWTLADGNNPGVGVSAIGPALGGAFTEEPGYLGFFEICAGIKSGQLRRQFDRYARVPHAYGQNAWVSYDDVESIRQKVMWVRQSGYAGVFVWEMSLDDFRGSCYQTRFPLLQTIKRVLSQPLENKPTHPNLQLISTPLPLAGIAGNNPAVKPTKSSNCTTYHTVKTGETAWNIARQYEITLEDLRQFNPLKIDLDFINHGERLCVALPTSEKKTTKIHTVKRGETAWDIANLYGISLAELQKRNSWKSNWDILFPGEELSI